MNRFHYGRRLLDERDRYRRWIDPRVMALPIPAVLAYLRDRGWDEVPSDRPGARVFREPGALNEDEAFYQFAPESERSPHYRQQLFELVTGLAEFEDRQASAVIDDILAKAVTTDANGVAEGQAADREAIP